MRRGRQLLVALATLSVLAGALPPAAQAAPWSDSFTVAEPHGADSGLYEPGPVVVDGETEDTGDLRFAFELGNQTTRLDAYGTEREVWPFNSYLVGEDNGSFGLPITTWVRARAEAPLAREVHFAGSFGGGTGGSGDVILRSTDYNNRDTDPHGPECLFLTGIQGRTLQEGSRLPLEQLCGQDLAERAEEENATVEVHVAEVTATESGGQAMRLVLEADNPVGTLGADLWYKTGIPYPIEINLRAQADTAEANETDATESRTSTPLAHLPLLHQLAPLLGDHEDGEGDGDGETSLEASIQLERFHRGQGATVPAGGDPGWPEWNRELDRSSDVRWGPPDGGESVRYPREEAVRSILEDPTLVEFQQWWDEHPDARAVEAGYRERTDGGAHTATWTFLVAAPDGEAWNVTSERTFEARTGEGTLEFPESPTENDAEQRDRVPPDRDPAQAPDRLPTIASTVDAWAARDRNTSEDRDANRLTWTHSTEDRGTLRVGWVDPGGGPEAEPGPGGFEVNRSLLDLSPEDGAARHMERTQFSMQGAWLGGATGSPVAWSGTSFRGPGGGPAALDAPVVVGVATASTLLLLGLVVVKLGAGLPLYSRLSRRDLLDQPTRRAVFEALDEAEGRALREVADEAGCAPSTARYHLRRLEEGDLAVGAGEDASRRWFAAGGLDPDELEKRAALDVGDSDAVYEELRRNPGASLSEVADAVGSSPPAAHKIVDRLVEAGLVEKQREGRSVALYPADAGPSARAGA
jgi:predicted transcriptional regulator